MAQSSHRSIFEKIDDFTDLISRYLEINKINEKGDTVTLCPFHKDENPSFGINIHNGLFNCFSCGAKGNIITLVQKMENLTSPNQAGNFIKRAYNLMPAKKSKTTLKIVNTIPDEAIQEYIKNINNRDIELKNRLLHEWRINEDAIKNLEIGSDGERITIPIKNEEGKYVNVRKYKFDCIGGDKVISYGKGYGDVRLWPLENLKQDVIWLCEGEKDCIVAIANGLNAVTGTGGAKTFKDEWKSYFKGKTVYVVYDTDDAGRYGAGQVALKLKGVAKETKNIYLELKKDLTDYFNKHRKSVKDLTDLVADTTEDKYEDKFEIDMSNPAKINLSEASRSEYFNKAIEMECLVVGKDYASYMPPKKIKISCTGSSGNMCKTCPLGENGYEDIIEFKDNEPRILNLIDCSDAQQIGWIKKEYKVPDKCKVNILKLETFDIEQVYITPELNFSDSEHRHVNMIAYYVGHGLESNKSYIMKGYTVPEPKHNHATHVITKAEPKQSAVGGFQIDSEEFDNMRSIFGAPANPSDPLDFTSIRQRIDDITKTLSINVTKIWGRSQMHEAFDLVVHTPISFLVGGLECEKGWGDALILGDTRTGKNQVCEKLMRYYGVGEKATAESMSYAGLIGGIDKGPKQSILTWGMLPLNDKRFVLLDELSGMTKQDIGKMTSLRGSGEVTLIKIRKEKTLARVRLLFLSNPRDGGSVKDTSFGIENVRKLVGSDEDIARLDFAMMLSTSDVNNKEINSVHNEVKDNPYDSEMCKKIILWCWSRKVDEIVITKPAVNICLQCAQIMSDAYSPTIPLVQSSNVRFKIAKLAVAYAGRTFNTLDGKSILVEPRHMIMAFNFLKSVYNSPTMKYDQYSLNEKSVTRLDYTDKLNELVQDLKEKDQLRNFVSKMLASRNEVVTKKDISHFIGEASAFKRTADEVLDTLTKCNAIYKYNTGYKKTQDFIKWLGDLNTDMQKEEHVEFQRLDKPDFKLD